MIDRRSAMLLAGLACGLTACTTFDIEGDGAKTPDSPHGQATRHGSFWGFEWSDWRESVGPDDHALYRVRYHTNALYTVATVCTLGLYVPQDVEWWCQPLGETPDETGGTSDVDALFPDS